MSIQWKRLIEHTGQGIALGKSTVVPFVFTGTHVQPGPLSNLQIRPQGDPGECVCQLALTFTPPKAIANADLPAAAFKDPQNLSTFYDNAQVPASFNAWSNPIMIVEWGIGGQSSKVICDVANGLVLNLCASYVSVQAAVEQIDQDTGDCFYQLSAFVGPGYPRSNNAQKTVSVDQWIAGVSGRFPLPFFAKEVSLVGVDAAGFAGTINFFRNRGGGTPSCSLDFTQANARPLPIPNGAMYFNIVRTSADKASPASAIFNLAV